MTIHGHLSKEQDDILHDIILNMKEKYPIIEIAEDILPNTKSRMMTPFLN